MDCLPNHLVEHIHIIANRMVYDDVLEELKKRFHELSDYYYHTSAEYSNLVLSMDFDKLFYRNMLAGMNFYHTRDSTLQNAENYLKKKC